MIHNPPKVAPYVPAPKTNASLPYADLAVIDLAKANTLEGRIDLSKQVCDAMKKYGFFYVINHGYTSSQTNRIFDIADVPFSCVGDEEKKLYVGSIKETGSYQGYKLRQYWHIDRGIRDQQENYSFRKDVTSRAHPEPLRPYLPEIQEFAKHNHLNVLHPILRLLALGLELPEETFVDKHGFSAIGEANIRFQKYYPRSEEEEIKTKNVWLKGHTDIGSVTILYSQPVAALQILTKDGTWKWIKHIENALVINVGDTMEFLSGGFYRATIHRVVQPPEDQRNYARLGVYYFAMSDDNVKLIPASGSPVLKRVGITRRFEDKDAPTEEAWRKARTAAYGQSELKQSEEKGIETEVIHGAVVRHFN